MQCKSGKPQGPAGQDSPSFPWDMNVLPFVSKPPRLGI